MIQRVVAVIGIVIVAVLLIAAGKPNVFRIQRSIDIDAPPEKVFALIDDYHNWDKWEPRDKGSTVKKTYSAPASGKDAEMEWEGSGSTGSGHMVTTESVPPRRIVVDAYWRRPFVAHNENVFTLEQEGASTKVTWTMQGTNVYMMKVMSLFMNMDRFMGQHFESGLSNLKSAAEKP